MSAPSEKKYWLDKPGNVKRIVLALILVDVLLLILGELIHKHGHFDVELSVPGFYAIFGFCAYCTIIAGAVLLRRFVRREEDYYDE
jgi:hypothetical protein